MTIYHTKTCCITGHRGIPQEKIDFVKQELRQAVLEAIQDGYTHFISDFGDGVNLYFAKIVAELKESDFINWMGYNKLD